MQRPYEIRVIETNWLIMVKNVSDIIDVFKLNNCSPVLSFHVARDGKCIYEKTLDTLSSFR